MKTLKMTDREFNRSIGKIRPQLISFAASFMCKGAATAEDMVQDAIIKVWREVQQTEVRSVKVLTITVLRNVCLDYLRLKKNSVQKEDIDTVKGRDEIPVDSGVEAKERWEYVRNVMKTLPKEQQTVMMLREVMGYEYAEIAHILDTSEANARALLSRGRRELRNRIR